MTDPTGGQSAAGETGQSAGTADPGQQPQGQAGGQSAPGATGTTPTDNGQSTVSREDYDRLRTQLAAADQKRVEAEKAHAQLRDKDMPEMQKAQRDLTESQARVTELEASLSSLRIENAFLSANTQDWHNPGAALQLLDRSKITVDSNGQVVGMKEAIEALAKSHAFLLKPKSADDGKGNTAPPPPGTSPSNGGIAPGSGAKPDASAVAARFPAMRQRI